MSRYDIVVRNGRVVLPGLEEPVETAIGIRDGRIAAIAEDIPSADLDRERVVSRELLHSAQDHTPFQGVRVRGWPRLPMLRSRVAFRDGELRGRAAGEFLERSLSRRRQPVARA